MNLDKNLDLLVRSQKQTVAAIARHTSVPVQTIHNWLNGCSPANLAHLKAVADYFEVTVDHLCFSHSIESKQSLVEEYSEEINAGVFEVILRRVKGQ